MIWLLLLLLISPAYAHGSESWIADLSLRDPQSRAFCCGPSDCHELKDGEVQEAAGGWIVKEEGEIGGETLPYQRGLPVSPDGRYHRCGTRYGAVNGGYFYFTTRCFIVPPNSM